MARRFNFCLVAVLAFAQCAFGSEHHHKSREVIIEVPSENVGQAQPVVVPAAPSVSVFQSCLLTLASGTTITYCQNTQTGLCILGQNTILSSQIISNVRSGSVTYGSYLDCCTANNLLSLDNTLNGVTYCTATKFTSCLNANSGVQCSALPGNCPAGSSITSPYASYATHEACCSALDIPATVPQPSPQSACEIPNFSLRLSGTRAGLPYGVVEVFYQGLWGTICDDGVEDESDQSAVTTAQTLCRFMGLPSTNAQLWSQGAEPPHEFSGFVFPAQNSEGTLLDNFSCVGTEQNAGQCHRNPVGEENCSEDENLVLWCR